jgi:predicted amidohydrolase
MENIKIATAQFENASGDKDYNLSVIRQLTGKAAAAGADAVAFHECSITGYSFARRLSGSELLDMAEYIPDGAGPEGAEPVELGPEGSSIRALGDFAREYNIVILAGLFERDDAGRIYKAYTAVGKTGLLAKYRKLHPFINPHITPGDRYVVFELKGWKCGILICYDNNIIENVRATALLGADIIFMPHVTMCTPSTRPGAGFVDPRLWAAREADPTPLRIEFDGLKGREWLMKWLPSRAYDNAIYAVFSNAIGMDDDQLKNGCSMIVDPFGDVIAECRRLGDDVTVAVLTPEKLRLAGGYRYRQARRPDLYGEIIGQPHVSEQKVAWLDVNVRP